MTSHDVRDVLNLPSDHSAGPRPTKKQKTGAPRPNLKGLAREVQNLGGDNPIAIVPDVSVFKKRRFASRKPAAKWELKGFKNSARSDDGALILRHWKRKTEDGAPVDREMRDGESQPAENGESTADGDVVKKEELEDSSFAKYNVQVSVPQYSEDQYRSNLQSDHWTKEETDYLLQLAKDYDLRWSIIWDRYDFQPTPSSEEGGETADGTSTAVVQVSTITRTIEDLKARYYEVAAKMMAVQKPAQYMTRPEFELYEMMLNFNPAQERARKEFALNTMARSKDEAREEESLLLEIKRILARTERFNEERRELYNRLDYPHTETDINSFKSSTGLQQLLQNLMNVDKSKKRKSLMGPGDGSSPGGAAVPGSVVSETALNDPRRRESIAASMPERVHGHGHRDSISGTPATPANETATPTAGANKKKGGAAQLQSERRKLTEQEEQIYGVTHHDRLGSGPTFRYEKINKLYSHKSGQQQLRITNALGELDVPARLVMPTAAVTAQFEVLWSAVTALVDLRKISDKIDAEIKIEEAKKAERDKARAAQSGSSSKPDDAAKRTGDGESKGSEEEKDKEEDQDKERRQDGDGEDKDPAEEPAVNGEGEEKGRKGEDQRGLRPGSSSGGGAHKRSASVLSTTSDKSAKRQKKQ